MSNFFKKDFQALIVIGGDFNADADSVPFKTIVGSVEETNNPELRPTVMCHASIMCLRISVTHSSTMGREKL